MSLRGKFTLYLVGIHLLFASFAVITLRTERIWLLAVEIGFVISLAAGLVLVRALFAPLRLLEAGIEFIKESDFSTRYRETGSTEVRALIEVYNRMIDNLREERVRNREQREFLSDLIAESPSGILILDLEGKIAEANPSAAKLLSNEDGSLRGRRLTELGSPFADDLDRLAAGEARILRLRGRRRVRCQKLAFMDRGFPRSFLLMEEMTAELHRSERAAYGKLIRLVSHEVNNTSGAVGSLLESCLAYGEQIREADRADFTTALEVARSRTAHMNDFVRRFADVVRLPPPRLEPCDVPAVLEDVAVLLRNETERRSIRWIWRREAALGPIRMDPTQMEQVFINLIKNSIEAIEHDGTITITIGAAEGRGFVAIRDTGGGIPPAVQDELFTPFFTTKPGGQGIGLTLVQEILVAHGCDFSLENRPGGEAEFVVRF